MFSIDGLAAGAARELADRLAGEGIAARLGVGIVHVTVWEPTAAELDAFKEKLRALAAEYGGEYGGGESTIDPWEVQLK